MILMRYLMCTLLIGSSLQTAMADELVFTLDAARSSLTLAGSTTVGDPVNNTFAYTAQGANSLITSYGGAITVDVSDLLNPLSITFLSSNVDANVNGNWLPSDDIVPTEPASAGDYGIRIDAILTNGKMRNVDFNIAAASTSVTGGSFAVSGQTFGFNSGIIDVYSTALTAGNSIDFTNAGTLAGTGLNVAAGTGTYSVSGGIATLTIPVAVTLPYTFGPTSEPTVEGSQTYTGTLVGVAAVPEPSSLALLSLTAGCIGFVRRRSPA
ncbi:PEP-CTERM sorting domain-containing protein [Aureliella helgolandensis]|uniref:Ice-binding protein C-terminal domain-containing protein n=1 Tax=Aureliella helgolandensis TaxID=2527968 RepID=A0A518G0A8_9BACT|nr:PEP-CTERM sorting domain-containing protein [Aureliella helgolandensis]QDV22035.1 hypothetical protein Q31a_03140 [Aureliella helgolandensis]